MFCKNRPSGIIRINKYECFTDIYSEGIHRQQTYVGYGGWYFQKLVFQCTFSSNRIYLSWSCYILLFGEMQKHQNAGETFSLREHRCNCFFIYPFKTYCYRYGRFRLDCMLLVCLSWILFYLSFDSTVNSPTSSKPSDHTSRVVCYFLLMRPTGRLKYRQA